MIYNRIRVICVAFAAAALSACSANPGGQAAMPVVAGQNASDLRENSAGPLVSNLIKDGSIEKPVIAPGSFQGFNTGQSFSKWTVVGASGNVDIVSGTFTQNGFTFPAGCGAQWMDLTGTSQTATGLSQTVTTMKGVTYTLRFSVGNVVNPNGIFGTSSTVNVLLNGSSLLSATNSRGSGLNKMVWKAFSKSFTARSTSTTIAFLNGDPSSDTANGLDCVSLK